MLGAGSPRSRDLQAEPLASLFQLEGGGCKRPRFGSCPVEEADEREGDATADCTQRQTREMVWCRFLYLFAQSSTAINTELYEQTQRRLCGRKEREADEKNWYS